MKRSRAVSFSIFYFLVWQTHDPQLAISPAMALRTRWSPWPFISSLPYFLQQLLAQYLSYFKPWPLNNYCTLCIHCHIDYLDGGGGGIKSEHVAWIACGLGSATWQPGEHDGLDQLPTQPNTTGPSSTRTTSSSLFLTTKVGPEYTENNVFANSCQNWKKLFALWLDRFDLHFSSSIICKMDTE